MQDHARESRNRLPLSSGRQRRAPEPVWFGASPRDLAGYLHVPDRPAVGGVLICAPFGYESTCAHRTLRRLADQLADDGNLVLRFDYEGTGASCGAGDESDLLDRWLASVSAGLNELRARGVRRPAVVGLRLGAALALAATVNDPEVGPFVLWAPVTSGKRYHRELRAQAATTPGGVPGDGSLNVFGHVVPAGAVTTLKVWNPLHGVDPRSAILVVRSPGMRDVSAVDADFEQEGLEPEVLEIEGTAAVLERDAELATVPGPLVKAICRWLDRRMGDEVGAKPIRPLDNDRERTLHGPDGPIAEEIVSVPPDGLYGVLTQPVHHTATTGVVFLNNGAAPAAGPGRAWVEFARVLAANGTCSLRFDLSGLGDSPDRSARPARMDKPVPPAAGYELLAAVGYLRARGVRHVTVVGLCSGAHVAVRTAAYRGDIDAIFALNPPLYNLVEIGVGPRMRRVWHLTSYAVAKRPVRAAMHRIPERWWSVLDRCSIFPSPARYLRLAARRGTSIHLIFSGGDQALTDMRARAGQAVDELVTGGKIELEVMDDLDHSMFNQQQRALVLDRLCKVCATGSAPALDGDPGG